MEGYKPPSPMQFANNISENWVLWRQQLENYMVATDKEAKEDNVKVAILLTLIGTEGLQIYNTFDFGAEEDKTTYDIVIQKFETYCSPKKNLVYEHFKFFSRSQLETETTDQYLTELKKLAANCEFKEREIMLRDRIVLGTKHKPLQEKMLREPDLALEKAIQYCQAFETSKQQFNEIQKTQNEVDAITYKNPTNQKQHYEKRGPQMSTPRPTSNTKVCQKCGYVHGPKRCPAMDKLCNKCSGMGHFAAMCRARYLRTVEMDTNENQEVAEDIILWEVTTSENRANWNEVVYIEGKPVTLKVDTGSEFIVGIPDLTIRLPIILGSIPVKQPLTASSSAQEVILITPPGSQEDF